MDRSGDHDGEDEWSGQSITTSDTDHDEYQKAVGTEPFSRFPKKQTNMIDHTTAKWQRLRMHYSDQYLEIFNSTHAEDIEDDSLEDSQFGSVMWTASDKNKFFIALRSKGRHDLASLADAVQTKSEVEIADYLNRLKRAYIERQMFAKHTKNVSQAQMEAAVEIGEECEIMLENAADALAAYQECYDGAATRFYKGELLIIDADVAKQLDKLSDETEDEQQSEEETAQTSSHRRPSHKLFHMSNFLELSMKLFMNMPEESEHDHWIQLADGDETPSVAIDVVDIFHSLVVSLVQRIVQTAIFLAQSRIRAKAIAGEIPAQHLKDVDIEAALDVLDMPFDAFDFWIGWVKRSKVEVVVGTHIKGQNDRKSLSHRQVEEILSVRASRGRRRSLSSLIKMTSMDGNTTEDSESEDQLPGLDEEMEPQVGIAPSTELLTISDDADGNADQSSDMEESDTESFHDMADPPSQSTGQQHMSQKRRRQMIEHDQDEYMERFDQARRLREEAYLNQRVSQNIIKAESPDDLGKKPRVQRKTKDDLHDWSEMQYRAVWDSVLTKISNEDVDR